MMSTKTALLTGAAAGIVCAVGVAGLFCHYVRKDVKARKASE